MTYYDVDEQISYFVNNNIGMPRYNEHISDKQTVINLLYTIADFFSRRGVLQPFRPLIGGSSGY